jgi:hypothetical protein
LGNRDFGPAGGLEVLAYNVASVNPAWPASSQFIRPYPPNGWLNATRVLTSAISGGLQCALICGMATCRRTKQPHTSSHTGSNERNEHVSMGNSVDRKDRPRACDPAIAGFENGVVTAIASRDHARARALADRFGVPLRLLFLRGASGV